MTPCLVRDALESPQPTPYREVMPLFEPMRQLVTTPRLTLRSWRPSDAAALRALWAERDPRSLRVIDADGHPTEPEMRERIESQLAESITTGLYLLAIERTGDSAVLGYCGLLVGSATEEGPEIGYELFRSAQGYGYAIEAARAIVDEAARTGRMRLWATVREWNAPSFRVLEKLEFAASGRITRDAARGDSIWMTRALTPLPHSVADG